MNHPSPSQAKPAEAVSVAEQFFCTALSRNVLSHAYILKGTSVAMQYQLVISLAMALNCENRTSPTPLSTTLSKLSCHQCKSCTWIAHNQYPSLITISRMTYQINDKNKNSLRPFWVEELEKQAQKSTWPKNIKTAQMGYLIQQLSMHSTEKRIVIFTDSEERSATIPSDIPPPYDWAGLEAVQDRSFHVRPLTPDLFNDHSINRFLKTLEEPPANVLFFFLVHHENSLLETIVSRCQILTVQNALMPVSHTRVLSQQVEEFLLGFFTPLFPTGNVYYQLQELTRSLVQEHSLSWTQAIEQLQFFWQKQYQKALSGISFRQYRSIQNALQTALKRLAFKTHEQATLIDLLLQLQQLTRTS
jgi:hypothetical protein